MQQISWSSVTLLIITFNVLVLPQGHDRGFCPSFQRQYMWQGEGAVRRKTLGLVSAHCSIADCTQKHFRTCKLSSPYTTFPVFSPDIYRDRCIRGHEVEEIGDFSNCLHLCARWDHNPGYYDTYKSCSGNRACKFDTRIAVSKTCAALSAET